MGQKTVIVEGDETKFKTGLGILLNWGLLYFVRGSDTI